MEKKQNVLRKMCWVDNKFLLINRFAISDIFYRDEIKNTSHV